MAKTPTDLFDATLRLGGHITHTVPRARITSQEITLLKAMHGSDAVVDVKKVGTAEVDERDEVYQLARKYANTSDPMSGKKLVERVLSTTMPDYEQWLLDQVELEQMERTERHEKAQAEIAALTQQRREQSARDALVLAEADHKRTGRKAGSSLDAAQAAAAT